MSIIFRLPVQPVTGYYYGYRGETPAIEQMQRHVEHDLWYIDNWSVGLDFAILLRTCFEVMRGKIAY